MADMPKMKTLTINGITFEVVDETARTELGKVVDTVASQFRKEFAVGYSEEEISNVTEWQTATKPSSFSSRQRSCCYGNGYYVIAGTSGQMAYRTKETAWAVVAPFTNAVITGLAYGNGRFLAVDSNGGIFAAATPDATWEQVFTSTVIIESVRYLNNRFVAVGASGFFATSLDGKAWTQKTAFTENTLIDSAYGNGWFIAVGASGTIFRSINLDDWWDVSIADFGDIRTALFVGNGFVVGGAGGKIAYSADAGSWSMATNNTTSTVNWIRGFAYAEKRIYAVMYISTGGGEIWVSKDGGATWTVDKSVAGRLWCVAYGDGVFFTSGENGAIYEMDLGIKWQSEEPDENAWYRFVATLSNGERIVSESYKSKGEKQKAFMIVSITGDDTNGYTSDKTLDEIQAALDDGKLVLARVGNNAYAVLSYLLRDFSAVFTSSTSTNGRFSIVSYTIMEMFGNEVDKGTFDTDAYEMPADYVTAGTFAGQVVANASGQDAGTSLLRNSKLVSAEENPTVEGEIVWVYK